MKFLLLVLAIHLVAEMSSNKIKGGKENKVCEVVDDNKHPAEY